MDVSEASRMSAARAEPRVKKTSLKMVSFPQDEEELSSVFGEVVNREDLTEEDRSALWLTTHEYQVFKQSARLESLACERENECTNLLENVFVEKCKHAQEKLNEWVSATPARRGLEKTANKSLGDARQQAQFQAVMDTLRSQDEMLISSGAVDDEEVRKVSLKATRTARHFARMIAKADALEANGEGANSGARDAVSNDKQPDSAKRNSKTKTSSSNPSSPTSVVSTSPTPSTKRTSKEKKEERKATAKAKKQEKAMEKEEKQKAKEEKQKAKAKEKARGKENKRNKEDSKPKTSFKEKLRETKAGIIARIPRIT